MPPKELVDEIEKAYNEYKKEKEKEVDYLTFYNGFVACNRNRQQENNKLLDVINNQDVKIADLERENAVLKKKNLDTQDAVTMQMYTNKANKEIADRQLTKAREILAKLLEEEKNNMYWEMNGADKSSYYEVRKQAEQLLKEIEK